MAGNPRTCVVFGAEWVWVPADVERGHWRATDNTGVEIYPASDGINDIMVTVPQSGEGGKEMVLHLAPEMEQAAFRHGAKTRRARAN